jgi:hypothetical protein
LFQIVQRLLQAGGKQVAAIFGQRAHKQFESGIGLESAVKVRGSHGQFIEVGQQYGMAE